jgi:hypothetical protein
MQTAQIIVTADPAYYEGDHRMWESFGSGAMVMTNTMWAPIPFKPVDKEHAVYFDAFDKEAFHKTLRYYVDHPDECARIGRAGLQHAVMFHRSASRVDYILSTAMRARNTNQSIEYKYDPDDRPDRVLRDLVPTYITLAQAQEANAVLLEWHSCDNTNKLRDLYASGFLWDALDEHMSLDEEAKSELLRLLFLAK